MDQHIRFCAAADGVRIAHATIGAGPPLVKAANWLNHLEFDWQSPIWRHLLEELARDHLLVRYDERGNGLSDWKVDDLSFDAFVQDLEAVVDAVGLPRFALLGISQGGAVAIAYAVRHPERVSHLILYGAYAVGWARADAEELERRRALLTLTRLGWGQDVPAYRQLFTNLYVPDATPEQAQWFADLQRISASPENAARLQTTFSEIDVRVLLPKVAVPTLVLHSRSDLVVPFEAGRRLAATIPGARFVALEGRNHLLLQHEPAWAAFLREVRTFLGSSEQTARAMGEIEPVRSEGSLTRERERERVGIGSGARIGRYEIVALVGSGGMGSVYRAHDPQLTRDVAIKVLAASGAEDIDRVLREARAASALNHPNICTVHEVATDGPRHFIVMELVDGNLLSNTIRSGGLDAGLVIRYGVQIADALAHAHQRATVHRDLKPANIAVNSSGHITILDFGIAARLSPTELSELTRATTVEALQATGTVPYLAPEALRGEPPGRPADVWALAVTLYELFTGGRPFSGRTPFELTDAILHATPPPLPVAIPASLRRLITRNLAKSAADRPSASEVRDELATVRHARSRRGR